MTLEAHLLSSSQTLNKVRGLSRTGGPGGLVTSVGSFGPLDPRAALRPLRPATCALGGGVDNRNLPGAQPVEAAVKAIVDIIENPKPEAYTSPFIAETIARYQRDPAAFEAEIASRQR